MSRKRSAYRPRAVISDPLSLLRPADPQRRNAVLLRFLSALDALARGSHPGEAEWRDLSDVVNTVETLAMQGKVLADEVVPMIDAATVAMVDAAARFRSGRGMRLDATGLQALRTIVDVYAQCLEALTEREMALAQAETQRRVNALLRARQPTGEVVTL